MAQPQLKEPKFSARETPHFEVFGSGVRIELNKRKKFLSIWALATFFSCVALLLSLSSQSNPNQAIEKAPAQKVTVLVPLAAIPKGTKLTPNLFKSAEMDAMPQAETALRSSDELEDLYARANIDANAPLTKDLVTLLPPPEMIESLIPPGSRAISLAVDATSGVEGWAKPGVHVDVLISFTDTVDNNRKTQIVVQNAIVLSFNGWTEKMLEAAEAAHADDKTSSAGQPLVPQSATVTLGVQSADALFIRNAQMLGTISLVLRNSEDIKGGAVLSVSEEDFRAEQAAPPPPPPLPAVNIVSTTHIHPKVHIRPEASVAYVDTKTGAEIRKEMVQGQWRLGE